MSFRSVAAALAVSSVVFSSGLTGQRAEFPDLGATIRVTAPLCGLDKHTARLTAVSGDTLVLDSGTSVVRCNHANLERLDVSRGRRSVGTVTYSLVGASIGGVLGGLGVRTFRSQSSCLYLCSRDNSGSMTAVGVLGGAAVGAGLGALFGTLIKTEDWEAVPTGSVQVGSTANDRQLVIGLTINTTVR